MAEQSTEPAKIGSTSVSVRVVSSVWHSATREPKTTPPKDEKEQLTTSSESVSPEPTSRKQLLEGLTLTIESSARKFLLDGSGDDLKPFTREVKLYLDSAMNSDGHYRSRGNWHVVCSAQHFALAVSSHCCAKFLVETPGRQLHVLVFYA